jgi:hypothetical protein
MADIDENATVEFLKAVSDHFKHITTLSSGFILVMATLLEKLFRQPKWKSLVVISFGTFALAIVCSVVAQAFFIDYMRRPSNYLEDEGASIATGFTLVAWGSFLVGALSLIMFAVRNFI